MNKYQQQVPIVHDEPRSPGYGEKQFLHTVGAGAWLPLLQAFITGVILFVLAAAFCYVFNVWDWFAPSLIIGAVAMVAMWLVLQFRWLDLTKLERVMGADLNGDGRVGPVQTRRSVHVQIDHIKGPGHLESGKMFDLPISEEQLLELARGTLAGIPFAEKKWCGAGLPFSLNEFRWLRAELIKRELLQMANVRDVRQGYVWTEEAMRFFEELRDVSPTSGGTI